MIDKLISSFTTIFQAQRFDELIRLGKVVEERVKSFRPAFTQLQQHIGQGLRALIASVDVEAASTMRGYVGRGSLTPAVEQIFADIGRSIAHKIVGQGGPWREIFAELAAHAAKVAVQVGQAEFEGLRMAGARAVPIVTAGRIDEQRAGSQELTEIGRTFLRAVNEIRSHLGEESDSIINVMTEISRLGYTMDEAGTRAAAYALAADKMANLQRGTALELMRTAVRQYGQSWEDVGAILATTQAQATYWAVAAEALNDPLARALSSQETLVQMYRRVQQATRDAAYDMVGLNTVFLSLAEALRSTGTIRAENLANVIGNFLSKMSPQTSDFASTVIQGALLRDILGMSAPGRQLMQGVQTVMTRENIPSSLFNVALRQYLAQNPTATESYIASLFEGLVQYRGQAFGTAGAEANERMVAMLSNRLGMSTDESLRAIQMAERYFSQRSKGLSPEESMAAMRQGGIDPRQILFTGRGVSDTVAAAGQIGSQALSAGEQLSLATERLSILRGENFWPKWIDIVKDARNEVYGDIAGKIASRPPTTEPTALEGEFPGTQGPLLVRPGGVPMEGGPTRTSHIPGSRLPIPITTGSYTMRTSAGVEQVETVIDVIAQEIAKIESGGTRDPYRALGKPILDPRSRMYGQRAIGKYQIMSGNVPSWTRMAIGRAMTPEEFMASPEAQERTAKYMMEKYYRKYGTAADVASMWHAGRPISQARRINARDRATGLETAVYAARVEQGVQRTLSNRPVGNVPPS